MLSLVKRWPRKSARRSPRSGRPRLDCAARDKRARHSVRGATARGRNRDRRANRRACGNRRRARRERARSSLASRASCGFSAAAQPSRNRSIASLSASCSTQNVAGIADEVEPLAEKIDPLLDRGDQAPERLSMLRVASLTRAIASVKIFEPNSPGTPSETERSKWPTQRQSTPGSAAMASAFSTPSAVSIWQKNVLRRLASTNLSTTGARAIAIVGDLKRDAAPSLGRVLHRVQDVASFVHVADHGQHEALGAHVHRAGDVMIVLRRNTYDRRQIGGLEIADRAFDRLEAESECSRSKSTKSHPADLRICPIPGVANSTMKWPNFGCLVRAISLRPCAAMLVSLAARRSTGQCGGVRVDLERAQSGAPIGAAEAVQRRFRARALVRAAPSERIPGRPLGELEIVEIDAEAPARVRCGWGPRPRPWRRAR